MKTQIRAQKISIDRPTPGSEPWVNIIIQRVELDDDYKVLNVVDRWDQVSERLDRMYMDVHEYNDPVTQEPGKVSVAGLADVITKVAIAMMISRCGGTVDERGYIILED